MSWPATRPEPPDIDHYGAEREALRQFLDYYRSALVDRAWGLTNEQLQITLPPSTLTLSRLIAHMAVVEAWWFREQLDGEDPDELVASLDFDADADAEMTHGQNLETEALLEWFWASVEDSRRREAQAASLDQISVGSHPRSGERWNLRWIMIHMIEEYARHCGHADLIRESIDGDTAS